MKEMVRQTAMFVISTIAGVVAFYVGLFCDKVWLIVTDMLLAVVNFYMAYKAYKSASDIAEIIDDYNKSKDMAIFSMQRRINDDSDEDDNDGEEDDIQDFIDKCNN